VLRLWNELNYEKRWAFFNRELTKKKHIESTITRYNEVMGVNAQRRIIGFEARSSSNWIRRNKAGHRPTLGISP
jgi:hypothetical protein